MPPRPQSSLKAFSVLFFIACLAVAAGLFLLLRPAPVVETPSVPTLPEAPPALPWQTMRVIGSSVEGRAIEAHTFGNGSTSLLFVGGIHGGYEWNSSLLAYQVMDILAADPTLVPPDLTIHIIPVLNPDGLSTVVASSGRFTIDDVTIQSERVAEGRFNAREVDLNRNFDCKWQSTSTWRGAAVSAGSAPFSEPEAASLRDYVLATRPQGVVFWHSQANNVYASECENGVLPETLSLMRTYAAAGKYGAVESFDAYPVTGDAEGWLASIGIPAVTVELEGWQSTEWERNWPAVTALFSLYSEAQ